MVRILKQLSDTETISNRWNSALQWYLVCWLYKLCLPNATEMLTYCLMLTLNTWYLIANQTLL